MKSIVLSPLAAAVFSAVGVSAHGYVSTATLDGTDYPGYDPYTGTRTEDLNYILRSAAADVFKQIRTVCLP